MGSRFDYDVFLNYRVKDLLELVDPLYHRMVDAGVSVFREDDELSMGQEISPALLRAIESSKIFVPIFSKNYASSSWCLRELAHIVDLWSESAGKLILPIFYDVDPRDVRLRTELYDKDLLNLAEKFGSDVTSQWRKALIEAASLNGWVWDRNPKSLGRLVEMVVEEVLKRLEGNRLPLEVSSHLVGVDVHANALMEKLDISGSDVRFIVIHGMGGTGKTVLAKVVFNLVASHFEGCSFLSDIREVSKGAGLLTCQMKLLSDILRLNIASIHSIDEGIMFIKQRLSYKKVLLVLDDIDNRKQLKALAGGMDWFGFGSRVIITCRDMSVLDFAHPVSTYEMSGLRVEEAFNLFNLHAFGKHFPPEDWYALSREAVSIIGELPLALEVVGSSLRGKSKAVWQDTLKKLTVAPASEVQRKLRISYDALEYETQQIFLDIACFFINKDVTDAIYMWEDCQYYPRLGIDRLQLMSLIRIADDHTIWMHNQLEVLGREIVRQENPGDPGRRSRVWHHEEALDLIKKKKKDLVEVRALSLAGSTSRSIITDKELAGLPNLRFLELEGAILDGNFKNLLRQLRYLSWRFCPEVFRATSLCLQNLVVLNLSEGHITDTWGGWSQIKMAERLKVLDLTGCQGITKMPDLSGFSSLQRLILCNCLKLGTIDSSIVHLEFLTCLNLKGCINLQHLPEEIGALKHLQYLYLNGCSKLTELPSEIGDLKSLLELNIADTGIQLLPKKLKVISSKKDKLSLLSVEKPKRSRDESSEKLKGVDPNRKGIFSFLTALKLSDNSYRCIESIPTMIIELVNLLTLDLEDCNKLQQLSKLPKSLEHLKLPPPLRCVLNILDLIKLVDLFLFDGSEDLSFHASNLILTSLKWIRKLNKQGNLESCLADILTPSIKLSSLSWLNKLSLLRQGLQSLIWLSSFLSVLAFGNLCWTNIWSYISRLKNSSNLWFYQYEDEEVHLYELEGLRKLTLENCEPLKRVYNFSIWKNLKELGLIQCPKLVELHNLGGFESLEKLHVKWCQSIESLTGLSSLTKLKILIIEECDSLRVVEGLDELYSLSSLKMWNCSMLRHITDISNSKIPDECEVMIWKCGGLRDFGHIGHGLPYKHYKEAVLGMPDPDLALVVAKKVGKMSDIDLRASVNLEESLEKMQHEARQRAADMETSDRNYAIAAVENVVGIDDHAKQITDLLEMEVNDEVRIIGIYGTDGIGKTTLAKTVYNRISSCFDRCSFLAEVEETTQNPRGIQFLQTKLISDILERDRKDPSFDETIELFQDIFREMKVLIVVDDVEKQSLLHAIVGEQLHWFGLGSRIIVTSQNEEILKDYDPKKAHTYMVRKLDDGQAFELFCKHAFRMQSSLPGYDGHTNCIVNAIEKLPLAIEVIGSFLRGQSIGEWNKMENLIKHVMRSSEKTTVCFAEILDICYEALNPQQKHVFLDIASFASGKDARIASYMWPSPNLPSSDCILMPLAKIGENNNLRMHKLIRCVGQRILNQKGSGDPIGRKFCIPKAISREKGMENVEAGDCDSMPDKTFLNLDNAKDFGDFRGAFPSVKWLCWQRCPPDFSEENFVLRELVILDLSESKITEDWRGWSKIKMEKLKVLNLTGCSGLLITPSFSGYKKLEILILERCSRLVKLDPSIGQLERLVSLNLKSCSQLSRLPVELGRMTALEELFIDGTSVREIPVSIGNLEQLKILSGFKCFPLTHLPSSISYLTALSELTLDCAKISELPSSLGKLLNLRRLSLRNCHYMQELPDSIGEMGSSLEELDISATSISGLPSSIRNLQNLRVLRMDSSFVRAFPVEIGNLTKLEELHASWCRSLKGAIPRDIKGLHHLRSLTLGHSSISSLPSEISTISSLHTLDLLQCNEIEVLPELPPSLICLRVSSKRMKAIPLLKDLKELEELCLSDEDPNERQPPSRQLMPESKVKQLTIWFSRFWNLELLQTQKIEKQSFSISFHKLRKLELSLSRITKLQFVYEPTDVPQLRSLTLSGSSLEEVSELPKTLTVLSIRGCSSLKGLPIVQYLTNLSALELYHSAVEEIKGLEGLKSLKRLDISNCKIGNLKGIGGLTSLRSLILSDCDSLSLPELSSLQPLKVLDIRRCKMIDQIQGLE